MTLVRFLADIDAFIEEDIPREVGLLARLVAIAALNKVVLKSPVDTGRFRGAWLVSIGSPTDDAPGGPDGVKAGSRGRSGRGAAAANQAITDGIAVIGTANPFESIYLQNNVEYAEALEDGGSDQAPRGVLAITVAELENTFR